MSRFFKVIIAAGVVCFFLSACTHDKRPLPLTWKNGQQLVLVIADGWNAHEGRLRRFHYIDHSWHETGNSIAVSLGSQGLAWGKGIHPDHQHGRYKREGDKRSPAGVFRLGTAFGYEQRQSIQWPFQVMDAGDFCMDQPGSPYYNQIINRKAFKEIPSSEPMRRDLYKHGDQLYRLGFIIRHNEQNIPFLGSCVFAHLRFTPQSVTAGCTAMDEKDMKTVLIWLNPARDPVFVLLPVSVYKNKQKIWDLPVIKSVINMK